MKTMTWNPTINNSSKFSLSTGVEIGHIVYADSWAVFNTNAGACTSVDIVPNRHIQNTPFTVLTGLHSEIYSLKQVIPLQVQSYQGHYLVSDIVTYRHGLGVTLDESLLDYEEDLISYFDSLLRNNGNLSAVLEHDLTQLNQYIEPL